MSRARRPLRILAGTASAAVLALTAVSGSATLAVEHLQSNVTTIDISDQVGQRAVEYGDLSSGSVTILLMGSDGRTGRGNTAYGYFDGARSDTTMLVHVYPDRRSALVVSIPRDTVMSLPSCVGPDGRRHGAVRARFNAAFDRGGPGCTVKAVESLSGLRIDHFVVLDFNGFKRTISALGGVEVCLNHPLQDARSGVDLPAGRTRVSGEQALAFVRVRHSIGDGSDISRINRQQLFLSSMIQEVSRSGLLTDPVRLWRVLDESTRSLAMDPGMADPRGVLALASSLVSIRPDDITFVTLPWLPSGDGSTVVADSARAAAIWEAIAADAPWPPPPTRGTDGRRLTVPPTGITVDVHNATGLAGRATAAGGDLRRQGFGVGTVDATAQRAQATTIRHSRAHREAARTLQAAIPGSVLVEDPRLGQSLDLTLGVDFRSVAAIRVRTPRVAAEPAGPSQPTSAAQDICTG